MKLATIEKIADVYPHPNANSLEFVKVLGYQCIVPKEKWKIGDWCILIQPDTVLPDAPWAQIYKSKSTRVKAIKLRGEWSFGIVEDTAILQQYFPVPPFAEHRDITKVLGVTKYEAPIPQDLNAKGGLPFGICKTDEDRWQNLDLSKYFGKSVDISLKVDGQSFTAYCNDGQIGVCGRTMEYKLENENTFTRNFAKYNLAELLKSYCEKHKVNIALRGEQYGSGIQGHGNNPHSNQPLGLMFFSCWDIDNRRYFSPGDRHYYRNVCNELGLPMVNLLESDVEFTQEIIEKYQNLSNLLGIPFEGVVVVGDGFSFKIINLNYDSRK